MDKIYLVEYINEDIYKELTKYFEIVDDKSICDIAITRCINIDKSFMDSAPNLKWVCAHGTGVDSVDLKEAKKRGIIVINAPKQNCLSVAELNVLLMMSIARRIDTCFNDVRVKGVLDYKNTLGFEISNKTIGFIGMGDISMLTAKMLKNGFNCNILGYNRTKKESELFTQASIDEVLENSDFVVLGLALNDETRGIIDLTKLKKMKNSAYLINATRGALVNHDDMVYALKNKIIAGYAADAFEVEPILINDPLLSENVIATPHVGGNTNDSLYRVGKLILEGLLDLKAGREPKYRIV